MRPFARRCAPLKVLTGAFLLGFIAQVGLGQSPTSAPAAPRDPQAVSAVQNCIVAMGGVSAIAAVQNSVTQGTMQAVQQDWFSNGNFTWQTSGAEFSYDNPTASGRSIIVSGFGKPQASQDGTVSNVYLHVAEAMYPHHLPAVVLLQALQNTSYSMHFVANETLNGEAVVHIQTVLTTDEVTVEVTPEDWYFDASSFMPVQVVYLMPFDGDPRKSITGIEQYSNYQTVSGVQVPFQLVISVAGQLGGTAQIQSVQFNTNPSQSVFSSPGGGS